MSGPLGGFFLTHTVHITHGDMEENVSGCFFSEHSVLFCVRFFYVRLNFT